MAIRQTSDSMSRFDPNIYGNLYDATKRVEGPQREPGVHSIHKDSIEVMGDKLKKEALERLRHSSKYLIFQNGFMRIGKYLFMSIAFPPYLLVYGLPKWIFVEALPSLVALIVPIVEKMQSKMKKGMAAAKQKMVQFIQFIQQMALPLIRPVIKMWNAIAHGFSRLTNRMNGILSKTREKISLKANNPKSTLKWMGKLSLKPFIKAGEWIAARATALSEKMNEGVAKITNVPLQALPWVSSQFKKLQDYALHWPRKWKFNFNRSNQAAKTVTEWLSKQSDSIGRGIKIAAEKMRDFCREWMKPPLKYFYGKAKTYAKRSMEFLSQQKKKSLHLLQKGEEKIRSITHHQVFELLHSLPGRLGFPLFLQKWMSRLLNNALVKLVIKAIFDLSSFVLLAMMKGGGIFFEQSSKLFHAAAWLFQEGYKHVSVVLNSGWAYLSIILQLFRKMVFRAVHCLLLFLFMFAILFVWGIKSVRKTSDKMLRATST